MRTLLLVLAGAYVAVGILFAIFETRLLYHPPDRDGVPCRLPSGVEPVDFGGERGLLSPAGGKGVVVFYHGNGDDACNWRFLGVNHLAPLGFDTLVVDYPGYGGDERKPAAPGLMAVADAAAQWAKERYETVVVMGYSLGTAPASRHAGRGDPAAVILVAPFMTMDGLLRSKGYFYPTVFLANRFDNAAALAGIEAPVTILYGGQDRVIPPRHALALADALGADGADVRVIERPALGHRGFFDSPAFDTLMADLLPALD